MRGREGGRHHSFSGPAGGYPAETPGTWAPLRGQQQISAFFGLERASCLLLSAPPALPNIL